MGERLPRGPQSHLYGKPSIPKEGAVSVPENYLPEAKINKPINNSPSPRNARDAFKDDRKRDLANECAGVSREAHSLCI